MRGNGERIGPQNLPTSSIAGGIWNLLNQQRAQQRGSWPSATPAVTTDPYFMYVPLLLNTTSTNGQQNNTFLDSSSNAFTITRNGTPTQGAFTPYQPSGYWSGYFDGSTAYLSNSTSGLITSAATYTVEAWIYIPSYPGSGLGAGIIGTADQSSTPIGFNIQIQSAGKLQWGEAWFTSIVTSTSSIPLNQWTHVAFVKTSSSASGAKIYINGVLDVTGTLPNSTYATSSFVVGRTYTATNGSYWNGYISNLRMVNGVAVYTGAFTTPTTPLASTQSAGTNIAAITGTATSLLTLQDNRFIDNSSNVRVLTANGTPKVQAFQPFSPAASYSAATYGGSAYFSGSSDYLSAAYNAAFNFASSTPLTVEFWFNTTGFSGAHTFVSNYNGATTGWTVQYRADAGNVFRFSIGNTVILDSSAQTVVTGTWYHLAVVRNASNSISMYLNGVSIATPVTNSNAFAATSQGPWVGGLPGFGQYYPGYISNLRIVNGTAIYTAAFTPPTLPVTAVSGTSLLINFTNAGIYDAAWQNVVTTVADAQASTTITAKWPPTSMKFDGTLDCLTVPTSNGFGLGTGDWTIEFWVYLNVSATQNLVSMATTTGVGVVPHVYYAGSSGIRYYVSGADRITGGALTTGVWNYIAIVKSSNVTKMYINGTQTGSNYNDTNNYGTSNPFFVGDYSVPLSGVSTLNGYVQDVRITKGVARTITTPTAAFPTR